MREIINSENAPKPVGPYNQAVLTGNLVFTSGQIPLDPKTNKFVEGGIKEHSHQVMDNLKAVLAAADTDFSKVVKVTVFLDDMSNFKEFNEVYAEYFSSDQPARSIVQVAALPLDATVEVEMIAISD